MKKGITIVDQQNDNIRLTKDEVIDMIESDEISFLSKYEIGNDFIFENRNLFTKEVILAFAVLNEEYIKKFLDVEYFDINDLNDLNLATYSNLSEEFLNKNTDYINWAKVLTLKSTETNDFNKWIGIIDRKNLWGYISANDLPIDFIRNWKHKLDWKFLSLVKEFTDDEKMEFSNYMVDVVIDIDKLTTSGLNWDDNIRNKIANMEVSE